jgi:dipeptidyl aminopeptidase/acylaminoacyl peptidase
MKILIIVFFLFLSLSKTDYEPLNFTEFQSMNRISSPVISPDGLYIVYSVKKWNPTENKSYTNLQYTTIKTKKVNNLTPINNEVSDTSPLFSSKFPNYVFFSRKGKIRYIKFPPSDSTNDTSIELTNYPISINDFKIKQNLIVFSADVYFSCENNITCSSKLIEKEEKMTYQTYDSLLAFHWDKWLVQGKGSHIFYQRIKLENDKIILDGEVNDVTKGMEINSPPLFTDNSNYDISNDGNMIAFSAHHREHTESWNTGWKTYFINLELMNKPILITSHTDARTQSPKFSIDDTRIAYLAMKTPMLESENLHFEIYNILTNKVSIIDDVLDISVTDFMWYNDMTIYFTSVLLGQSKIFTLDISNPSKPKFTHFTTNSTTSSYSLPFHSLSNRKILYSKKVGYDTPDKIVSLENLKEPEIVNLNKELLSKIELPTPEAFNFIGGYNETVYGWIIKPINFDSSKKYPVALLIHGGPESSWTSGWSYSWNPQVFSNRGYAVIMINPHGSIGVSSKFQDAVRNDWGGIPYEDIINGLKYVLSKNNYMDDKKICAAGGSYGGYMINWIEGHSNLFKCLVNHDGAFSVISKFYGTDELWFQKSEFCPKDKIGCNPFDGKEIRDGYEKNSPERFVKFWNTPMLVIHGGKDYRVPLTEALSTFTSLQLKGVESKFLFFPLENHWVLNPVNQIKWYEEVFEWFGKYTKE